MQRLMDNEDTIKKKNGFLQPVYRDLKTIIRHMTYTEEYKLLREYVRNRQLVLDALPEDSQKAKRGLQVLKEQYSLLIANQRARMRDNAGYRLDVMKKRLEDMFRLLNCWQQYIDIIYAPEVEINFMKVLKDQGQLSGDASDPNSRMTVAPDEASFAVKMQREDIERRLQTLFARTDEEELN